MSAPWRQIAAALLSFTRGSVPASAAARLVPLAGLFVGSIGAGVYWLGAQLWPTSVAVMLAMLATVAVSMPAPAPGGAVYRVFFVLLKYNALMALSSARVPFPLPEHMTLGLVMVGGQAVSRALVLSIMAADSPPAVRITAADLTIALICAVVPATLLGIPGLAGLAAAIALRLGMSSRAFRKRTEAAPQCLDVLQQLTEITFYLGALATWRYV